MTGSPIKASVLRSSSQILKYGFALLTWIAVGLLCWILAYWTWIFVTPKMQVQISPQIKSSVNQPIEPILNAHIFGESGAKAKAVSEQVPSLTSLGLKLRGVLAGRGKAGVAAIIFTGQKNNAFAVGNEVLPGVILEQVNSDHVQLSNHGVSERLNLDQNTKVEGLISITKATTLPPVQSH